MNHKIKKFQLATVLFLAIVGSIFSIESEGSPKELLISAKDFLNKAKFLNSLEFSPEEFKNAEKLFEEANVFLEKDITDHSIVIEKLTESIKASREASYRSAPEAINLYRKQAEDSLNLAEESYSEGLSPEIYFQAKENLSEGDVLASSINQNIKMIEETEDIQKKSQMIDSIIESSIQSIQKFVEAKENSQIAKTNSLSLIPALLDSQTDIDEDIRAIRLYTNDDSLDEQLNSFNSTIEESREAIEKGNVKFGIEQIQQVRLQLNDILSKTIVPFTKTKIETAKARLESAEKNYEKKNRNKNFPDSIVASRETLVIGENMFTQERYSEAIERATEALDFLDGFYDPSEPVKITDNKTEKTGKKDSEENNDISITKKQNSKNKKIKIHKVKKTIPPETLIRISQKYYKEPSKWKKIFKANKKQIKDSNLIFPGQNLIIP
jgi:nucleoid-associated protein YgaU